MVAFTATGILMVFTMALNGELSPATVALAMAGSVAGGADLPTAASVTRADSVVALLAGMVADSLVTAVGADMEAVAGTDRRCFS